MRPERVVNDALFSTGTCTSYLAMEEDGCGGPVVQGCVVCVLNRPLQKSWHPGTLGCRAGAVVLVAPPQRRYGADFSCKFSSWPGWCRTVAPYSSPLQVQAFHSLFSSACGRLGPPVTAVAGGLTYHNDPFVEKLVADLQSILCNGLQQFVLTGMPVRICRHMKRSAGKPSFVLWEMFLRFRKLWKTSVPSLCDFCIFKRWLIYFYVIHQLHYSHI